MSDYEIDNTEEDDFCSFSIPVGMRFQWPRKAHTVRYVQEVTLEDLYNGTVMSFSTVPRDKLCPNCNGKGSATGILEKCIPCHGTGIGEVDLSTTMNIYKVCTICGGFGEKAPEGCHCIVCGGSRIVKGSRRIMFTIQKGYDPERTPLPFIVREQGLGNASRCSKVKNGDIEIVIKQKPHAKFLRKGHDLIYEHTLSLSEAMCGFEFIFKHLDGRTLLAKSQPGEVTQPEEYKVIPNEGMPVWNIGSGTQGRLKGNMYVLCHVRLPEPGPSIEKSPLVVQLVDEDEQTEN